MTTNNVYNRTFKTKREEYEEKLKQRNDNEPWIFGNNFGRPGGGAPLRDKNGNVISNLKTISNGNIFKYDAQDFTKGENNISLLSNNINGQNNYNENIKNNSNVNNAINDPFVPFRNYINQFEQGNNNNNKNTNNIQQNITSQQLGQNPYLVLLPDGNYGIISPYPIMPTLPNTNMNNISSMNLNNNINEFNNQNINYPYQDLPQRPYSSLTNNNINNNNLIQNADFSINNTTNNKIPTNFNNTQTNPNNNNINSNNITSNINPNQNNISFNQDTNMNQIPRKYLRKIPESTLFNEALEEKIKLEKERKNDLWKKELLEQIKEKKKRDEKRQKESEERDKKEALENDKYLKYKKKQREEHNKKIREEQEKRLKEKMMNNQSQSVANILDLSNNIEQANKSIMSNNNVTFREGNLINISHHDNNDNNENNDNELSQNNINPNNNEENIMPILNNNIYNNNNNYNNMLYNNSSQEQFKDEINRQYQLLNETLNHDINLEKKRISKELDNNYTPFTRKFILMNTNSKTRSELSLEQNKKFKKIESMIEDKKLVDYILGNRQRPPSPKDEMEKIELPIPSYFGINRDNNENKYLGLHSKSSFINKGENLSSFIASGRNQNIGEIMTPGQNMEQKERINDMYNFAINNDIDLNYINSDYNNNNKNKINYINSTFGTNINNDESLGGMMNVSHNLDNISVFIPLNKNRENINKFNEKRKKPLFSEEHRIKDKDIENMYKELDKIYELTNNIDVSSKARNISDKFDDDLNKIKNRENIMNKYLEINEANDNDYSNSNRINNNLNIINNKDTPDKISEERSNLEKTSSNKTKTNNKNEEKEKMKTLSHSDNNNINEKSSEKKSSIKENNKETNEKDYSRDESLIPNENNENKENADNDENLKRKNSKESYLSSDLKSENEKNSKNDEENLNKENLDLIANTNENNQEPENNEQNEELQDNDENEDDEEDEEK